jgi:hypothetical protein
VPRNESNGHEERSNGRTPRRGSSGGIRRVAESATQQLGELTGRRAEFVSGIERTDEGWRLTVEMVEVERIPDSTSVMASYDVQTDGDGNLTGYARSRRYVRSQSDTWEA